MIGRTFRLWKMLAVAALVMTGGFAARAQQTNGTSEADFSNFQVISERNIFNPNRTARHKRGNRSQPVADAFALVGTMSYAKGTFAFFDGTSSEYRKAVQNAGTIAGYKVTDITPTTVKLANGDKQLVIKVGTQMRREEKGSWQLAATSELPVDTTENADAASTEPAASDSDNEGNDVLKRLMKQREQELQ
ncbi:MAG: hypothetical protein ABSA12_03095 [Verrucomicrobiia bacterium]|jgi:hypothetical protein